MSALDQFPTVGSFFGIDLKTGCMMIAAISLVHPMTYGCTFFTPLSYLLVTIWILVALYFAASVTLLCGLIYSDNFLCSIWIWYTMVFVILMLLMMILLIMVFTSRMQASRAFIAILGMLYYILTIYFIFVVNSHRLNLGQASTRKLEVLNWEEIVTHNCTFESAENKTLQ